ncbi:MAG: ribosome small subunit-dependent GTPase A [Ignavibacteriae bacterium HGW-Ignavibacteriae-3]|nr:MAG: ribosome small subunit-dependent GTPase A [Ignavibacteriae bacterium HGW-Ignavibacteriae-3]
MEAAIPGTIFKIESKDYYLFDENFNEIRCSLPGKFQKEYALKRDKLFIMDIVAVGDKVDFELNKDGTGVINKIHPRKNFIARKAPRIKGAGTRGERLEQIVASNIDNLIIVSSCHAPKFNNRLIDRLIVASESSHINIIIVVNKVDLDPSGQINEWVSLYESIGYRVFKTSVVEKSGTEKLMKSLSGKINLIWGQSGVGKSSLLNLIYPSLQLKVGEISHSTSKGKHTTVTSVLKKIDSNTFVIDTPGMREMDPYGIRKQDLSHYFKDFYPFAEECRFNTCTHHHEPGCAVAMAVSGGKIHAERYQSYLNLLDTIESDMNF